MNAMLAAFEDAALAAGKAILRVRATGARTSYKPDSSPVTEADEEAERIILERLGRLYPDIPVVAEEAVAAGKIPATDGAPFFLVDPLDGTKEFVSGHDDFTVNIALVEAGVPTMGFIYAPALALAYGGANGEAYKIVVAPDFSVQERLPIKACAMREPPVAVASRSHRTPETDAYLAGTRSDDIRTIGSSLKFCLLAEGQADLYPPLRPHHAVGYGRRRCDSPGGGWIHDGRRRPAAPLRAFRAGGRTGVRQSGLHRLRSGCRQQRKSKSVTPPALCLGLFPAAHCDFDMNNRCSS